jgi:Uma2 family endonuclease
VVCPDIFVAKGVPKYSRRTYKLWEEGKGPCMVIEVTSRDTRREDIVGKKACYEALGVEEYFLHDPLGEYLDPPLQGFRLIQGRYVPMESDRDGSLSSLTTGLRLRLDDAGLRLVDAATGELLLRGQEARDEARQARWERAAREAAEAELARLRRELKRRDG